MPCSTGRKAIVLFVEHLGSQLTNAFQSTATMHASHSDAFGRYLKLQLRYDAMDKLEI